MTGRTDSKTRSPSAGNGAGATDTLTGLRPQSPAEFAEQCRQIVTSFAGHEMHREFDEATNALLCSLGYSEGCEIFIAAVAPLHSTPARLTPQGSTE